MRKLNKKSFWILALFFLFIASNSYAELSDALSEGFLRINDFFASEQYLAYSKLIDFLFFSLLFISVYLIGVKYAFKQVSRPEKMIAVILGLMSAFLMTANNYSIIDLLPYTPTFLYIFLFVVFWLILKGIQSKFLRFIVALLLTLAAILVAENLIYTNPDELFKTFTVSAIFVKNHQSKTGGMNRLSHCVVFEHSRNSSNYIGFSLLNHYYLKIIHFQVPKNAMHFSGQRIVEFRCLKNDI